MLESTPLLATSPRSQEAPFDVYDSFRFGFSTGVSLIGHSTGLNYQGESPINVEIGKRLTPSFELGLLYNRINGEFEDNGGSFFAGNYGVEQSTFAINSRFYLQEWGSSEPWLQLAVGRSDIHYTESQFGYWKQDSSSPYIRGGIGVSIPLSERFRVEPSLTASTLTDSGSDERALDLSLQIGFSYSF